MQLRAVAVVSLPAVLCSRQSCSGFGAAEIGGLTRNLRRGRLAGRR